MPVNISGPRDHHHHIVLPGTSKWTQLGSMASEWPAEPCYYGSGDLRTIIKVPALTIPLTRVLALVVPLTKVPALAVPLTFLIFLPSPKLFNLCDELGSHEANMLDAGKSMSLGMLQGLVHAQYGGVTV